MAESIIANCTMRLKGLLSQEPPSLLDGGAEDRIRSLILALESRRPFLRRSDHDRGDDRNLINDSVKNLISAANDAEIAVDTYYQSRQGKRNKTPIVSCVDQCVCITPVSLRRFIAQIEAIETRVNGVVVPPPPPPPIGEGEGEGESSGGETDGGGSEEEEEHGSSTTTERTGPSDTVFDEDKVVGLDDDIKAIVGQLTEGGHPRRLSIISIFGMGGLGKTTLAKKAYEHTTVNNHFSCKAWVPVSRQCRKRGILLDFIRCLWGKPDGQLLERMDDADQLKELIFNHLKGKRYVLVVDDIWRIEDWEFLKGFLPDSSNGSRVLLTTRFQNIAESADPTIPAKELHFLEEEQSWELLCTKAFPHLRGKCPTTYEEVGRSIAKKCGGLPIQLVVLGGLLHKKKKMEEWNRVLAGVDEELGMEDRTSRVLALSYDDLPGRLKTCFLYLSVFPEDYEIPSSRLVRLWVAEGFVEQEGEEEETTTTTTMEEVAEGYLEALIKRSLVMAVRRNVYASVETCRVHDLLLDLSVSEARHMWFLDVQNAPTEDVRHPRRIATHFVIPEESPALNFSPTICSLIHFGEWRFMFKRFMTMDSMLEGINLLRVVDLDLGSSPEKILLKGIGRKTLLTHLALDWGPSTLNFPSSSIGNFHNLQTLDLRGGCPVYLPAAIWNLEKLRHLIGKALYIDGQPRSERRYDLQTLSGVRDPEGWNKRCHLARLTNLRRLNVSWLRNFSDERPLAEALRNLKSLRILELTLETHRDFDVEVMTDNMAKLLVFQDNTELREMNVHGRIGDQLLVAPKGGGFPPNITKLDLSWAKLTKNSFAMLEQLPKLQFLTISDGSYAEKELVCHAGGFLHLESLVIDKIDEIEKWEAEEGSMPKLRTLTISFCGRLEMLPEGLQHMKTLQKLLLESMTLSFLARVHKGEGEDWWKVQHIPTITIIDSLNVQALAAVGWGNQGSVP